MLRRRKVEDHANHEAWAIPYGDLVTLLMAFFVVMYAVSVVDAGKYRVLSNSLVEAFGAPVPVDPIQIGEPSLNLLSSDLQRSLAPLEFGSAGADSPQTMGTLSPTDVAIENVLEGTSGDDRQRMLREISEMSEEIEAALDQLIEHGDIQVNRKPYWLEIAINTNLLFSTGSATLEPAARPVLQDVARILSKRDARIHVEGHTDDRPIRNSIYPSNWELSSGRAATVVNLFAQNGVDPNRMVAIGYAEFQPLADNDTEGGRSQNRRVEVVVLPGPSMYPGNASGPERLRRDYEVGIGELH